jgi:diguanylate cyclase (GGDEF)-like protein
MEKQVLVVEDDPRVLRLLKELLAADGYTVVTASDGEEGLRAFKPGQIDVVVTDVKMPRMDGLDMMKAIKALDPSVEVIVLTGYGTLDMTIDVLRNGGYDFLKKPDEIPQRIRPTVQRAFEKRLLGLKNQELLRALEEANTRLGRRIQEKTTALEATNQQLENTLLTLAEINQRLRDASFIDEQTGLFNRQYFEQHLNEDVARSKRYHWDFALAVFEFTAGDPPGSRDLDDETWRWIAETMRIRLREGDLIARYDEDRVALVLPAASAEGIPLCERIKTTIEERAAAEHPEGPIRVRFGIVYCPEDSRSADMLLVAMDRAIEEAP